MSTAPISDGKYKDRWSIPGSAERNSIPINEAITPLSTRLSSEIKGRTPSILEIASGMGTQISTIAKSNPNIIFQPTETDLYLKSQIDSRVKEMGVEKNVRKTKILDLLEESDWKRLVVGSSSDSGSNSDGNESESSGSLKSLFDGVLICNLTHICPFEVTQSFFAHLDPRVEYQDDKNGAQTILNQNHGLIAIYGPFNERGGFTSEGNRKFDESIKSRNPSYGLRDIDEEIIPLAKRHGYELSQRDEMPSGNKWLVFRPSNSSTS